MDGVKYTKYKYWPGIGLSTPSTSTDQTWGDDHQIQVLTRHRVKYTKYKYWPDMWSITFVTSTYQQDLIVYRYGPGMGSSTKVTRYVVKYIMHKYTSTDQARIKCMKDKF